MPALAGASTASNGPGAPRSWNRFSRGEWGARQEPPTRPRERHKPPPLLPEPWLEAGGQRIQALELEQKAGLLTHMGERG